MRKERKHYTAEEKVAILRRHLLDNVPVSDLTRLIRPTQFHANAYLQRGFGEDRIPFRYFPVFLPLQSDGLRPVKYAQQGTPAPIL